MLILTVRNLKKAFVDRILFENLNFDIDSKDKVGLCLLYTSDAADD